MDKSKSARPNSMVRQLLPHILTWSNLLLYVLKVNLKEKEVRKIENWPNYHYFCAENQQVLKMNFRHWSRPISLVIRQPPAQRYWFTLVTYSYKVILKEKEVKTIENSPTYFQFGGRHCQQFLKMVFGHYSWHNFLVQHQSSHKRYWSSRITYSLKAILKEKGVRNIENWPNHR